ncbi:MAG TPA: type IV toxin-antitoxin system AbiEi family antitoxin domain-containing protein [Nocardioides sp.]
MTRPRRLDELALARLLREQDGVVTRRQVQDLGGQPHDVRRMLRRRELAQVHPGVYVDHTGEPSRRQLQWAAVLALAPAWLHRESALEAHGFRRDRERPDPAVHVMVDASRTVEAPPGVRVERVRHAARWAQDNRRPPRAHLDFALLKVASGRTESSAVALLADACQQGLTTPQRLLAALAGLPRLPGRAWLLEVLRDVAAGTRSVLERRFLREVERAHGLPIAGRQHRTSADGAVTYRDAHYRPHRTVVELDGRFGHTDSEDRWHDLERDIRAAVDDLVTLRPGWRQVLEPCRLAAAVARVLQARGWTGEPQPCGPKCRIGLDRVGSESPGGTEPTRSPRTA